MLGEKKKNQKQSFLISQGYTSYRDLHRRVTDYEAFVLELIVYLANSAKIAKPLLCYLPGFIDLDV